MANIVCISKGTVRPGICEEGDVVGIHDDDVALTGPGYFDYQIIHVDGMSTKEIRDEFDKLMPETDVVDEKEYWFDGVNYKELKVRPKYSINTSALTLQDKSILQNSLTNKETKIAILNNCEEKIHLISENNETIKPILKR